ncbi:hypothetical protein H312_00261 [Anncaliia algerae PRA339]|uniref:PCI domain-containing protein n=1 Tax=Anncaliia algerae PRA339 TaxID=1288291 RepID=A0A059F4M6_9MICR|nr:hypothetical protein H312_00261 [Anncaliia algerae PRA339]
MAITQDELCNKINKKIKEKNAHQIASLLRINSKKHKEKIQNIDYKKIREPFDQILGKFYLDDYASLVLVLDDFDDKSYWMTPVYRKVVIALYYLSLKEKREEEYSKVLINIFRINQKCTDKRFILTIVIILLNIYFNKKKMTLFDNLISVIEPPDFISKESLIFYYFAGINSLINENFVKGNEYLKKAFKHKFINKEAALPYVISILLLNKRINGSFLKKYNINYNFILNICRGKYNLNELPNELLHDLNLTRICLVHFPNINLRHLVYNVYKKACVNHRLNISYLKIIKKCNDDEIYASIIKLIGLGYLKGYLSMNFELLVLSKVDPFPKLK